MTRCPSPLLCASISPSLNIHARTHRAQRVSFVKLQGLVYLFLLTIVASGCDGQRSSIDPSLFEPARESEIDDATAFVPPPIGTEDLDESVEKPTDDSFRVSVVNNQFADSHLIITLHGEVTAPQGTEVERVEWLQLQGPDATIMEPDSIITRVALPGVTHREELYFRLLAVTADGSVKSAVSRVTVLPLDQFLTPEEGIKDYLEQPEMKAFALAREGKERWAYGYGYGYSDQDSADRRALDECETYREMKSITADCTIIMRGDIRISSD